MPRLYLVRHGEPEASYGTRPDPGLSERGRAQAAEAAWKLAALKPRRVLTSPLVRCRETAAALEMETGLAAAIEPRVAEVAPPDEAADRRAWLAATFPAIGAPNGANSRWTQLGAALLAFRDAAIAVAGEIAEDSVVFTHYVAINAIVGAALGADDTIVCRPAYASITTLDAGGDGLRIVALGAETASVQVL
jgi:broad specificity phosphatase PhoE